MSRYKAYPEYKDSEVEWLGKVPVQWELTRVKYVSELTPKKPILDRSLECSFIPMEKLKTDSIMLDESRVVDDVYDGYTYFQDDDILMAKVTPCFENKNIAVAKSLVNGIGFGSSEIYVIRTKKDVCNRYWFYRFQEDSFMDVATAAMTGAGGLKRVPSDVVTNFTAALPSFNEQQKIANFLDHETAKIDTLIAKQQELIKLLKEKRQAVISHAVTKGLNPNAPMRDSGVEWLGEVPAHWEVSKFGYISNVVRGGSPRPAGDPTLFNGDFSPWVTVAEITKDDEVYLTSTDSFLTKLGSEQCRIFSKGTLLLSNSGATLGVPKILSIDANANDGVVGFEQLKINSEFAYFYLTTITEDLRERIKQGSGQPNLNTDIVKSISIAIPEDREIVEIVDFINATRKQFKALTENAVRGIELLQERRTALISAAVTGKIDVRDWQPPSESAIAA